MAEKTEPQYIFLIILDAVRKDHLSLYGYGRKTTPNIDKLSKHSDTYNWAFAPSSYTLASVPSILAGKYPFELSNLFKGSKLNDIEFKEEDFESLNYLKKQGYNTAMFTANIVTSHYYTNINQFFDFFSYDLNEEDFNRGIYYQKSDVVLKAVKNFIKKNKKEKNFIVIHLMEAHGPYTPWIKEPIFKNDDLYKKDKRLIDRVVNNIISSTNHQLIKKYKIIHKYQLLNLIEGKNGEIEDFNRKIADYIIHYDMGIYLQDLALKDFFQFLEKNNIYNQSKIIITADHGELLGENNLFFMHGLITHPVLTNVPLIIKNPDQKKLNVINRNFILIDLIIDRVSKIIISHPQDFSLVKDDTYINIHNSEFSEHGVLYQNLFLTANLDVYQFIDNFKKLKIDIKISIFKKNHKKLIFEKRNYKTATIKNILEELLFIYKKSLPFLEEKIRNKNTLSPSQQEIKNLNSQLSQKDQQIKNLTAQLKKIQSSKTYKIWQGYCKIMKKLGLKKL